jgi:integrase/recombinase XerC
MIENPQLPIPAKALAGTLPAIRDVSAARLYADFIARQEPSTRRAYKANLRVFAAFAGVASVETIGDFVCRLEHGQANALVLDFKADQIRRGYAPATINNRLAAIRSLIREGRSLGLISWTIEVRNVREKKFKDTAGPGEDVYIRMLEALQAEDPATARIRAGIRLLHDIGLRRSEVVSLDLEDLNLDAPKPSLVVRGKGRFEKEPISLPPPTVADIRTWIAARGGSSGPLFLNYAGRRLSDKGFYDLVKELGQRVGAVVRPHGLRHTAVTEVVKRRGPVAGQKFARHASINTTMGYVDNLEDEAGAAADAIAPRIESRPKPFNAKP